MICRKEGLQQWRGRLSDLFEFTLLSECLETRVSPNGDSRTTVWCLSAIKPRQPGAAFDQFSDVPAIQEKVERLQVRLEHMRTEYQDRYPGAAQSWTRITDLEREIRDLRKKNKRLLAKASSPRLSSKGRPIPAVAARETRPVAGTSGPQPLG